VRYDGRDYQNIPHIIVYPSVVYHCASLGSAPDNWHEPQYDHGEIRDAIMSNWKYTAFFQRLAAGKADIPGLEIWRAA
jgi:hypothetical protein